MVLWILFHFDPMNAVEILELANHQDWVVRELAQQGATSRAFERGEIMGRWNIISVGL